jgi:ankyrin repeat protein
MPPTEDQVKEFIAAAAAGNLEAVRMLGEAAPELIDAPLPTGERAIHAAHYHGQTAVCDYLYAHGVQHDIFLAVALGQYDDVRAMLEADPSLARTVAPLGATPLHTAVFWGYPRIAELLLDHGADANSATGRSGFSPLHSATAAPTPYCPGEQEDVVLEAVNLLLAHGADVHHRSVIGLNAVFNAAANGDLRVAQRLVEAGADPGVAGLDNGGQYANKRPVDVATERGYTHVAEWLRTLQTPA